MPSDIPQPDPYQMSTSIDVPPSRFEPLCHPLERQITKAMNDYFMEHWHFEDKKSRTKFLKSGFSTVTCWYCPLALDDRIQLGCRFLTLGFLVDDLLEHMSLADGEAYNGRLIAIIRGDVLPDRSIPVEYMMHDLWEDMRTHDLELANEIMEPSFEFMRAQTATTRLKHMDLKEYLEYRENDVGRGFLAALSRFCMGLKLTPEELLMTTAVSKNSSKHISVVNDIWSYDKEQLASKTLHEEGAVLCNAVCILAKGASVPTAAAKRVLYVLCREWEILHEELVAEVLAKRDTPQLRAYMKTLEFQMSGNEIWSRTTPRYRILAE
ncbi:hypothetical protein J1614_010747 [Plenodomus biglobosus]|nr:hypothetical protein J1614_010747 [Plenodomus biglobosus]